MVAVLFWNINKNALALPLLADLAAQYDIDIIVLAECATAPATLLYQLNNGRDNTYFYSASIGCDKIVVLTRFHSDLIQSISESPRVTIRHLTLPGVTDILIAATHHVSKNNTSPTSQYSLAEQLSILIRNAEESVGHCRTVLVGDLNMNPFEDGMVSATALHAVSSQEIALKLKRKVQGTDYPFFYNPMWNFLGDAVSNPPGTYYYGSSDHISFFWNTFDQVLVRPDLLPRFQIQRLKIISTTESQSLLSNKGIPKKKLSSDHLPIVFSLDL